MSAAPRTLYNLGSGPRRLFRQLPDADAFEGWQEIRVDVDPDCRPDILADLTDLRHAIPDGAAGMIYCSHVIEHFFDHDVSKVLAEFARILHPNGAAVMRLPDLAAVVRAFDEGDLERPLYQSPSGPIAALDVIYGHRRSIEEGNAFMAHRTGFTEASLARRLLAAGFDEVQTVPGPSVEFCALATMHQTVFTKQVEVLLSYVNP
ncbi:class I SAM-dependent methyltransferase [Gemmobacter lutimaris]|nr:methyltransferase domain-containing protein [Gemmobacter lutimaris]